MSQPSLVDAGIEKIGFDLKWVFALCFKRGLPRGRFLRHFDSGLPVGPDKNQL